MPARLVAASPAKADELAPGKEQPHMNGDQSCAPR
jgi:hypothetical protein